jgi:Holliday junction resolvase
MKLKGSAFERDVVGYLRDHGHPYVERCYGAGRPEDVGDIDGIPGFVIEAKAHKALNLAGWSDEAECERMAGRQLFAAVIAKRRGKPTSAAYVVLTLDSFARLVVEP